MIPFCVMQTMQYVPCSLRRTGDRSSQIELRVKVARMNIQIQITFPSISAFIFNCLSRICVKLDQNFVIGQCKNRGRTNVWIYLKIDDSSKPLKNLHSSSSDQIFNPYRCILTKCRPNSVRIGIRKWLIDRYDRTKEKFLFIFLFFSFS